MITSAEEKIRALLRLRYGDGHLHYRARFAPRAFWKDLLADAALISFPKCGRTWLRFMLGQLVDAKYEVDATDDEKLDLESLGGRNGAPFIRVSHEGSPDHLCPHEFSSWTPRYLGRPVVFLVRDPRDVIVSLYFHHVNRSRQYSGSLDAFMRRNRSGLATVIAYYNAWLHRRRWTGAFRLMRYEDLKSDPKNELQELAAFLNMQVSSAQIADAVELSSFEKMRRLETSGGMASDILRPPAGAKDESAFKTRSGKVGGHKKHFNQEQLSWANQLIHERLDPSYGYRS
jgi:hypothetical protein